MSILMGNTLRLVQAGRALAWRCEQLPSNLATKAALLEFTHPSHLTQLWQHVLTPSCFFGPYLYTEQIFFVLFLLVCWQLNLTN